MGKDHEGRLGKAGERVTLEELKNSDKAVLTAEDIAPIMQSNPQAIRLTARKHPERLGFPVVCVGNRVKIPREPFLRHWTGGQI